MTLKLALLACASLPLAAAAQPNFSGKTVTLVVGYKPGGGYDATARMLARHLPNHLPGKPTVIYQLPDHRGVNLLVLDEPTNHLDIRHQVELLGLLRAQRRTTLISLHDLNAAASLCDRLHGGCQGPIAHNLEWCREVVIPRGQHFLNPFFG